MLYILNVIIIQHFKLHKNCKRAINVNLMLKIKMCKNNSLKIRTRTYGEGVVLEIRKHPDRGRGGLKIRDFGGRLL